MGLPPILAACLAALAAAPASSTLSERQRSTGTRSRVERMMDERETNRPATREPPAEEEPQGRLTWWDHLLRAAGLDPRTLTPAKPEPPGTEDDSGVAPDGRPRKRDWTGDNPTEAVPPALPPPAVAAAQQPTAQPPAAPAINLDAIPNEKLDDPAFMAPVVERYEQYPHDPALSELIGRAAFREGDFNLANKLLTAAIEDGAKGSGAYYLRGASALNLGNRAQAVSDLNQAVRINPGNRQAQDLLKLAAKQVSPAELKNQLRASGLMPKESARPANLAALADTQPYAPPALGDLTKTARAQLAAGDLNAALRIVQRALQADPKDLNAGLLHTEVLLRQGQYEEAEKEATRVLGLFPGNPLALNMRATARNRLGRYALALEDADAALQALPNSPLAHFNRAFALAGLRRRAEAVLAARQASLMDSLFMKVYLRLRDLPEGENPLLAFQEAGYAGLQPAARPPEAAPGEGLRTGLSVVIGGGAAAALFGLALWSRRRAPAAAAPPAQAPPAYGAETLGPGIVLAGNYQVEGELGRGSMGVVFKALDLTLKRPVAIKMLRSYARGRSASAAQLLQEAQLVAGLKHPNIVQIHTVVAEGEDVLLVFEYVEGRPLSAVIADFHHLPLPDVSVVLRQVADALDYAHGKRVIHRDLKPGNIMIAGDGTALVMDFGLAHQARQLASRETQTDSWGSPDYMAPEQELGTVSAASDIYALGVCLYEMLTGETPFAGGGARGQKERMAFTPATRLVPGLPPETDAVLHRALQAQPAQRYGTARQLADAFDALLQKV